MIDLVYKDGIIKLDSSFEIVAQQLKRYFTLTGDWVNKPDFYPKSLLLLFKNSENINLNEVAELMKNEINKNFDYLEVEKIVITKEKNKLNFLLYVIYNSHLFQMRIEL